MIVPLESGDSDLGIPGPQNEGNKIASLFLCMWGEGEEGIAGMWERVTGCRWKITRDKTKNFYTKILGVQFCISMK